MQYSVSIPGIERRQVKVEIPGLFSGARLLVDGVPASKGAKRGEYLIRGDNGTEMTAKLKHKFLDPVPDVVVNDQQIKLVEPLLWYQWLWAGLPILLIFGGGAIGGATGFLATSINTRIFRSDMSGPGQYGLVALVSVGAVILYFILAMVFVSLFR